MLGDKQEQDVGPEGTGIQAGGDIKITQNIGPSVADVREICLLVFRENFPVLQAEAMKTAENNVRKFTATLESKIIEKSKQVVLEKFAAPDVQAAINDAVKASARKGEKSNPSILVDLIAERVSVSTNDYKDMVISEALTVVPKLTKQQISYLSFIQYMTRTSIERLSQISDLEPHSRGALSVVSAGFDLSESQKRHMEYAGACSMLSMMSIDIYGGWMKGYKHLGYTDLNKFKNDLATFAPSSKTLLDAFEKDIKDGQVTLTSVGQAIAIANLSTKLGKMDYSIWLK